MMAEKINTKELFQSLDDTTSEFLEIVSSFDEQEISLKPQHGGWTPAQIAEHVTMSNNNIIQDMSREGKVCEREPDLGVERIKSIFLNFEKKLNSPQFILPTKETYQRETVIHELKTSIDRLMDVAKKENPFQIIHHAIFGDVTRLETLYFVVYHTQRHIHQLKNIQKIILAEK
ncbi:MAG TPA: DinB family protein [Chitinophagaceae bacterium]